LPCAAGQFSLPERPSLRMSESGCLMLGSVRARKGISEGQVEGSQPTCLTVAAARVGATKTNSARDATRLLFDRMAFPSRVPLFEPGRIRFHSRLPSRNWIGCSGITVEIARL